MSVHDFTAGNNANGHDLSALAGPYVLDALDAAEREAFEEHLAGCPDCRAEVAGLRVAAVELSYDAAVVPPPELRERVLAAAHTQRPLPPTVAAWSAQHRARRWAWPAVAAACAVLAVLGGVWGFQQHRSAQQSQHRESAISSVLDSPDASAVSGDVGGGGHATVVYSRSQDEVVLIGRDLPALPSGKTYQLWLMRAHHPPASLGTFRPNGNGYALVQRSGRLTNADGMGISVEPAGGSRQPTPGAIVATMTL